MSELTDRVRARLAEAPELSNGQIARELGTSRAVVWRVRNPEAWQRARHKYENTPERNAAKRQWDREHPGVCDLCGGRTGRYDTLRCRSCTDAAQAQATLEARTLVQQRWREGATIADIARELGQTENAMGVMIVRMREAGWDMPYRRRPSNPKHPELVGS